jgi:CDP-paratose 2-epimerase
LDRPVTIYGDGKQIRDVLWVDELIRAYVDLFHRADTVSGEIYNIGGGPQNTLSLLELVEMLKNDGVMKRSPDYSTWRPGDQKVYVSNISRVSDAVGWRPVTDPAMGVKKLVEWAKENKQILAAALE